LARASAFQAEGREFESRLPLKMSVRVEKTQVKVIAGGINYRRRDSNSAPAPPPACPAIALAQAEA